MKTVIMFALLIFVNSAMAAPAESPKTYSCEALDGNLQNLGGVSYGQNKDQAEATFLGFVKQYGVTKVSCSVTPKVGGLNDLGGKKWGFQGLKKNETYLVFQDGQLLFTQECGTAKLVQKFNLEIVGDKSFKLTAAGAFGDERACNPYYVAGFKSGSVVSFQVLIREDSPASLFLTDKRPGEETPYSSLYIEMRR